MMRIVVPYDYCKIFIYIVKSANLFKMATGGCSLHGINLMLRGCQISISQGNSDGVKSPGASIAQSGKNLRFL